MLLRNTRLRGGRRCFTRARPGGRSWSSRCRRRRRLRAGAILALLLGWFVFVIGLLESLRACLMMAQRVWTRTFSQAPYCVFRRGKRPGQASSARTTSVPQRHFYFSVILGFCVFQFSKPNCRTRRRLILPLHPNICPQPNIANHSAISSSILRCKKTKCRQSQQNSAVYQQMPPDSDSLEYFSRAPKEGTALFHILLNTKLKSHIVFDGSSCTNTK